MHLLRLKYEKKKLIQPQNFNHQSDFSGSLIRKSAYYRENHKGVQNDIFKKSDLALWYIKLFCIKTYNKCLKKSTLLQNSHCGLVRQTELNLSPFWKIFRTNCLLSVSRSRSLLTLKSYNNKKRIWSFQPSVRPENLKKNTFYSCSKRTTSSASKASSK